jgi:hypothetical protein
MQGAEESKCVRAPAYFHQMGIMLNCPCQTITTAEDLYIKENGVE